MQRLFSYESMGATVKWYISHHHKSNDKCINRRVVVDRVVDAAAGVWR
jgi:hypothetical protein